MDRERLRHMLAGDTGEGVGSMSAEAEDAAWCMVRRTLDGEGVSWRRGDGHWMPSFRGARVADALARFRAAGPLSLVQVTLLDWLLYCVIRAARKG